MSDTKPGSDTSASQCIIYVSVSGHLAGPARSLLSVVRAQPASSVRHILIAPRGDLLTEAAAVPGLTTAELPRGRRFRKAYRLWGSLVTARHIWRHRKRCVAIHANGLSELSLAGPGAVIARSHVVAWSHASLISGLAPVLAKLWQRTIRQLDWAAVSVDAAAALARASIVREEDVTIIPNPISSAEVVASRADRTGGPIRIGFLSGATLNKGFDVLVEAVGLLADLDVEWCLFTNLDSKKADQRLVAAAKGYTNVTPVGHVSDVAVAYSQVDIVFVPSRRESFGRVAAEAMLNGLPVVATDIPAMRRVVGDAGLLFTPGDAGAAADQIRAVVTDPELRARINQMAPIRARAFDPDRVRGALDLLYGAT